MQARLATWWIILRICLEERLVYRGDFALGTLMRPSGLTLSTNMKQNEWAGAVFSPDGKWLFANVYKPGFTVAITGPWKTGLV